MLKRRPRKALRAFLRGACFILKHAAWAPSVNGPREACCKPRISRLTPSARQDLTLTFQQFTGTNAVGYYAPLIFKAAGAGTNAALYEAVIVGAIKVVFVIVLMLIVDRLGRKRLLVTNGWAMAVFLTALGIAFAMPHIITWLVLGLVFLHTIAYELSWGGGVWIVLSEIYPNAIRGRAMSIASFALWFATNLVAQFFPILLHSIGGSWTFFIFAAFCVIMALFMKRVVPETSGKTMERIQSDWMHA